MPKISPKQFAFALKKLDPHGVRYENVKKFLREHYDEPRSCCWL
jgi:hypothetical protein